MKIAFVWWFDKAEWVYPNWRDGLRAAVELIGKEHDVVWHIGKKLPDPSIQWDFILLWDDSNSEFFQHMSKYNCRKGLCLTTDPHNWNNLRQLDVVYCESDPIYNAVRQQGLRAIKAFGTDTDFFTPNFMVKKNIEYFYPATFSPWKRQSEIAHLGDKLVCIGTVQPDGKDELQACLNNGVQVMEGYFPVEVIRDYYQHTKKVIIAAVHGSERTVLESMACGVWPIVLHPENVRTHSYLEEFGEYDKTIDKSKYKNPGLRLRQFVIDNYSHVKYAQHLLKGMTS